MPKCTLYDKECDLCGECDDYCPYKHKLCDNCFECLEEPTEDYAKITIDAILMDENEIKNREGREELKVYLSPYSLSFTLPAAILRFSSLMAA